MAWLPDKVLFKTQAIADTVVDSFQGATATITALPRGAAVKRRDEDAPILPGDVDADDSAIVARIHLTGCVALGLAIQAISRRRAAIFQGVPAGFETLKG
ncbi:MAG: hypothetical protein PHO08_00910 [Methylococcales bacterium]|nr:hypothetical protein [Methylococcales bacterium]